MAKRIDVTEEDIRKGIRLVCSDCPVALAISRATGQEAHVYGGDVQLDGDARQTYDLPTDVVRRIEDFDTGEPMLPFSFELSGVPD